MHVLRIQHATPDYPAWKAAFDSEPLDRTACGVRRHRVLRPADDPGVVMIDLEFETADEARAVLAALREMWTKVTLVRRPEAVLAELVEVQEY
ncbi:hypothetical protein [Kitasatospora sp. NPDC094015]|uniref:hypothetical protein n=1 Tax=Kitasatospora sp. NPDC094015 TaxID=3155205 RepID=UPI0033280BC2